jgi:hypothetical protein
MRRTARRTGRRTARRTTRRQAVARPAPVRRPVRRRRPLATMLAAGGIAAVAYNLGKNNVKQIEEYSGKPIDQMNEDELNASMNALGIELPDDEGDADDYDYDDYDDAPAQEPDYLQELERLAALRDQGVITNEDFEAKKQQLLGL